MTDRDRRVALEMIANRPSRRRQFPIIDILPARYVGDNQTDGTLPFPRYPVRTLPRLTQEARVIQPMIPDNFWKYICGGMIAGYMVAYFAMITKMRGFW